MRNSKSDFNRNKYFFPLIIIAIMLSILGFAVGIIAFFVPFLKKAFQITTAMSYLVTTTTFSAFVIFGISSGKVLELIWYRKSIFIAFILMRFGILFIVPAATWNSFSMFLRALFINGIDK